MTLQITNLSQLLLNDFCVQHSDYHVANIVSFTHHSMVDNMQYPSFIQDRSILTPTLDLVEKVNDYVMCFIPGGRQRVF